MICAPRVGGALVAQDLGNVAALLAEFAVADSVGVAAGDTADDGWGLG